MLVLSWFLGGFVLISRIDRHILIPIVIEYTWSLDCVNK